ncbi:MAG TPA: alanine-tRNA synthetase second additional domain-containing protein [Candidatus Blautia stercoripullorum]|uniref:Alanine-tRNA synthetase second additional domain-containing protein n=1 Tax=Candidatus Blautia stercoripullorum TaxID=2838502 RepID=A0A9D2U3X7_9FIRM|nr:alanine-tRNA synthetase second additional domain-containing protein [Candidatus Blautia stercoripullorum]
MAYSRQMQDSNLYSFYFAPRGNRRMADLGMQLSQMYLSPFDHIIGIIGDAGAGKSLLIKGMFPGLDLTNDDEGVNVRPLPLLHEDLSDPFSPHTYHLDIRFESAFTQMHVLAEAILEAARYKKMVIVEHFELIHPFLKRNADLLVGIGEEIIITRPNMFGPLPENIANIVHKSVRYRKMAHTLEDLCVYFMGEEAAQDGPRSDVRHGFVLLFEKKPGTDLYELEKKVREAVKKDLPVSYYDENHVQIGDYIMECLGPRMHISSTGKIEDFTLLKEYPQDPATGYYMLIGLIGKHCPEDIRNLNRIDLNRQLHRG